MATEPNKGFTEPDCTYQYADASDSDEFTLESIEEAVEYELGNYSKADWPETLEVTLYNTKKPEADAAEKWADYLLEELYPALNEDETFGHPYEDQKPCNEEQARKLMIEALTKILGNWPIYWCDPVGTVIVDVKAYVAHHWDEEIDNWK